jgi:hypothetical protein
MSATPRPPPPALRACLLLAALAGCAPSQPTRYYTQCRRQPHPPRRRVRARGW